MTTIILYILNLLSAPIEKFWLKADEYKENQQYGKMVAAFAASTFIIASMIATLVILIYLAVTYFFEVLIMIGCIIWIYWAVWQKMHKKSEKLEEYIDITQDLKQLYASAQKGYPPMRTIIFQTLKRSANDIMAKPPRALGEIEVMEEKYIIENNIIFYQFQLPKADIKYQCMSDDIEEFKLILQTTFNQLWQAGNFPQIALQMQSDTYSNMYDPVIIDRIDDLGNIYLIQTVFTTTAYMEQVRRFKENAILKSDVVYDPTDSNFL